jgi:hypothetical protein
MHSAPARRGIVARARLIDRRGILLQANGRRGRSREDGRMGETEEPVTASLIIIGNEILSGRTVDANLSYIASRLGEIGIRMAEVRVVPDEEAAIVEALNACRARHTYVFTTGGIGPTHDDITRRRALPRRSAATSSAILKPSAGCWRIIRPSASMRRACPWPTCRRESS